jgi:hypothetical protein
MKLIDLIPFLLDSDKLSDFYHEIGLDEDSDEENIIYMKEFIDLDSELEFMAYEETDGEMEIAKNDIKYYYFFSIEYAAELIEDLNIKDKGYTNQQIAQRLIEYRIKDA